MVHLRRSGRPDGEWPAWIKWVIRRAKLLTVLFGLVAASATAWAVVANMSLVSLSGDFREVARIGITGDSLPTVLTRYAVFRQLLQEEQNKKSPDWQRLQAYKTRLRELRLKIIRLRNLRQRYQVR